MPGLEISAENSLKKINILIDKRSGEILMINCSTVIAHNLFEFLNRTFIQLKI